MILVKMKSKIGFPQNPTTITINRRDYNTFFELSNDLFCKESRKSVISWINETPIDHKGWDVCCFDVNAYYSVFDNEIIIPCGILEYPFYVESENWSNNLGGLGSIIAHEIIHGFDSTGYQFDSNGNKRMWWSGKDKMMYNISINRIKLKYSKILIKVHSQKNEYVNLDSGKTLNENIADIGGVDLSYRALKHEINRNQYFDEDTIKKMKMLFFVKWAKLWRNKTNQHAFDQDLQDQDLQEQDHSPPEIRANMVVSNIDDFYTLFDIKKNYEMWVHPNDRIHIW